MASLQNMDSKQIIEMYENCAFFLFLDVPVGTHFGIDMNSWDVGHKFRGVKLIPPGLHFIYYSAVSKEGDTAPRTGFFYNFKPHEIVLRKWDEINEGLKPEIPDESEVAGYRSKLRDMDRFLGPYPYDSYKQWISLTENITPELLYRLQPERVIICSVAELVPQEFSSSASKRRKREVEETNSTDDVASVGDVSQKEDVSAAPRDRLPDMDCKPGTQIRFTEIPSNRYPSGCGAKQITKYGMDSSYVLSELSTSYKSMDDILGEVQLAFVCFLVGNVYDAFEQWKKLVRLLCTCDEALEKFPEFYKSYLTTLFHEIKEVPRDFFVDIVSSDNFLTNTLQIFFENVKVSNATGDLKLRCRKFQEHLTRKFRWNFDEEPEDCAPVIVENVNY